MAAERRGSVAGWREFLLVAVGAGLTLGLYGIGVWSGSTALTSGVVLGASAREFAEWYVWSATVGMFAGIAVRGVVSLIAGASGRLHGATTFWAVVVAAVLLASGLWTSGPVVLCVAAFCVGWSYSCLVIFWMTRIYVSPVRARYLLPAALLCAALVNACYAGAPQNQLHLYLVGSLVAAAVCSALLPASSQSSAKQSRTSLVASLKSAYVPAFKRFGEVLFCVVAIETIAPTMNYMGLTNTLEPGYQLAVVCVAQASAAVVLFVVLKLAKTSPYSVQTFKFVTPVLVLALFPAPFAGHAYSLALLFAGSCLHFVVVNMLFSLDVMDEAREHGLVFEFFYATAFFALMMVCVALDHAMPVVLQASNSTELLLVFGVFTCIYLLSMAFVFARRRRKDALEFAPEPGLSEPAAESQRKNMAGCLEILRARHGLSERETEVVELLLHGKNVPAIAEELVISQNTVRSHVKRIYRATDVHTRQELISYCEDLDAGAEIT